MLQVFRPWGHYARAEAGLGFPTMADVVFDVDGEMVSVPEAEARIWGEKLIGFAAGNWGDDVALLTAHGHDPKWLEGARALGQAIEDVLTGTWEGAIPIDSSGKGADAIYSMLSLPGPSSWDATSGAARLRDAVARHRQAPLAE